MFRPVGESIAAYLYDIVDIQQHCCIVVITTKLLYNTMTLKLANTPEFYTGAPVDPVDLRFRGEFVAELWRTLDASHAVLTAPRRTGKTSVMDYLRDNPERGFSVVSINVQDLTHPADFFLLLLLDALHDVYPVFVRDRLAKGWALLSGVLGKINEVGFSGFKIALRGGDPEWRANWRQHGETFLAQARATGVPILLIVDEFPDMLLNLSRADGALLREFLAWFRTQRQSPAPVRDSVRWLVGGSVNLAGTLDALGLVDLINDLEDVSLPPLNRRQHQDIREGNAGRAVTSLTTTTFRNGSSLGWAVPFHSSCRWRPMISIGCGNERDAGSLRQMSIAYSTR